MTLAGALITIRARIPAETRAAGPTAIRNFYRDGIDAMNRTSQALACSGVALTGHGYNADTGDMMMQGVATNGRRAVVDDLRALSIKEQGHG